MKSKTVYPMICPLCGSTRIGRIDYSFHHGTTLAQCTACKKWVPTDTLQKTPVKV